MPRKLIRWTLASTVFIVVMALAVASAMGVGGVETSVPALQQPSQVVNSVPQVSVPSVPSVPSTPSVPSVTSTPSVPSVPSVQAPTGTPSLPSGSRSSGGGSSGSGGGGGSSGAGGGGSSSSSATSASGGGSGSNSTGGGSGARSKAQAQRGATAHGEDVESRRLRTEVTQLSGCLGTLPSLQRRLLGLRAGIGGRALSRGAAARRLGISTGRARALERGGLRSLRSEARSGGCGGGASTGSFGGSLASQLASQSSAMPQLQPAVALSNPPAFVSPGKASASDTARQGVLGATASSGSSRGQSNDAGLTAAISRAASTSDPAKVGVSIAALALLALLAGSILVRRRAARPAYVSAPPAPLAMSAPAAPVAAPSAECAEDDEPEPEPAADPPTVPTPPAETRHPSRRRAGRPAAIAASGLLSLAVSRLVRDRRRH